MRGLRAWLLRLGGVFRREHRDRDLHAELESHLQLHIEDGIRSGLTRDEARRQAVLKLGGIERTLAGLILPIAKRKFQRSVPEHFKPRHVFRNEIQFDFKRSDVRQGEINRQPELLPRHDPAVGDRQTRTTPSGRINPAATTSHHRA